MLEQCSSASADLVPYAWCLKYYQYSHPEPSEMEEALDTGDYWHCCRADQNSLAEMAAQLTAESGYYEI
jgi:hypothetical protein